MQRTQRRVTRSYMRYEVVAVDINGGQDQTGHEHHQAKRQAAQAIQGRLFGPQDQLVVIILEKDTHNKDLNTSNDHRRQLQSQRAAHSSDELLKTQIKRCASSRN